MNSTLAITRLLQMVAELAHEATPTKLKELGWSQYELDQAISMGLLELTAQGYLQIVEF